MQSLVSVEAIGKSMIAWKISSMDTRSCSGVCDMSMSRSYHAEANITATLTRRKGSSRERLDLRKRRSLGMITPTTPPTTVIPSLAEMRWKKIMCATILTTWT
eukprot:86907-Ditylum_brightwellii.AAC.1